MASNSGPPEKSGAPPVETSGAPREAGAALAMHLHTFARPLRACPSCRAIKGAAVRIKAAFPEVMPKAAARKAKDTTATPPQKPADVLNDSQANGNDASSDNNDSSPWAKYKRHRLTGG